MRRILDILIVSLESRELLFNQQMRDLTKQIVEARLTGQVMVLSDIDEGEVSIGFKRNRLLKRAEAEYVISMDDDDAVSETLVQDLVEAIGPGDVDCIACRSKTLMVTGVWQTNEYSIRHTTKHHEGPSDDDAKRIYCSPPRHTCAIRREIMLQYPFPDISRGEDTEQALQMAAVGALKTERMVERPIYFYTPSWLQKRGIPPRSRPFQ